MNYIELFGIYKSICLSFFFLTSFFLAKEILVSSQAVISSRALDSEDGKVTVCMRNMTEHQKGGHKGFRFKIIVSVDGIVCKNSFFY